jgi:hypothetical protein
MKRVNFGGECGKACVGPVEDNKETLCKRMN